MSKSQAKTKAVPAKTRVIAFKVTPKQYAMIQERAGHRGVLIGPWIRSIVLQAAQTPPDERFIQIHEPNGATS